MKPDWLAQALAEFLTERLATVKPSAVVVGPIDNCVYVLGSGPDPHFVVQVNEAEIRIAG